MENYFATNLKHLRTLHNDSQDSLTEKINGTTTNEKEKIHRSSIGRWENNEREPSVFNVIKISDVYNISMADLIGRDLRVENSELQKNTELELLKKALIEKGYLEEGKDLTEENFKKLMEIYNLMMKGK